MVDKGMDSTSVFSMCDEDVDNGIHDVKEAGGGVACAAEGINYAAAAAAACAAPPASRNESSASLRNRRRARSSERPEPATKRESWIDPPEMKESTTLTQAEIESCMQSYEVQRMSTY